MICTLLLQNKPISADTAFVTARDRIPRWKTDCTAQSAIQPWRFPSGRRICVQLPLRIPNNSEYTGRSFLYRVIYISDRRGSRALQFFSLLPLFIDKVCPLCQSQKRSLHFRKGQVPCVISPHTRPGNDYNVPTTTKRFFLQSNGFPEQPGNPVPEDTVPGLFADGKPESRFIQTVLAHIKNKILIGYRFPLPVNQPEILVLFQPSSQCHCRFTYRITKQKLILNRKTRICRAYPRGFCFFRLCGQSLATLQPSGR